MASFTGIVTLFIAFNGKGYYNNHAMQYKVLFLDVDGTIVPYKDPHTVLPSKRVAEAIAKASQRVHICLATGRPLFMLEYLLLHLNLTNGLAVINDGAQVLDLTTKEILYRKAMFQEDVEKVASFLKGQDISFFLNDGFRDTRLDNISNKKNIFNIFTMQKMSEKKVDKYIDALSNIPTIKASKTHHGITEKFELLISHAEATKLHGIIEASKRFGVKKEETIGVGDSGNDFPLLMASGLKVAMGNSIPDLKAVADYIAPPVEKDGLAEVIEKFILSNKPTS